MYENRCINRYMYVYICMCDWWRYYDVYMTYFLSIFAPYFFYILNLLQETLVANPRLQRPNIGDVESNEARHH